MATSAAYAQDWKKLVAAANAEGEIAVSVQSNRIMEGFFRAEWPKAHPEIRLSVSALDSSDFIIRLKREREAGLNLWDFMINGLSAPIAMYKQGLLDPLQPEFVLPEVADPAVWGGWDQAFYDSERRYVLAFGAYLKSPFYNAKLVAPDKIKAQGLKVLLDPEYKGRIYWHDPSVRGSGRSFALFLRDRLGDDGLTTLVTKQQVVFLTNQNDMAAAMARGKSALGIGPAYASLMQEYAKAGLEFDVRPFGNTPEVAEMAAGAMGISVINKRPHPNATRLFVNWFLSRDTMQRFAEAMRLTMRRTDITSPEAPEVAPLKGARYSQGQNEDAEARTLTAIEFVTKLRETR